MYRFTIQYHIPVSNGKNYHIKKVLLFSWLQLYFILVYFILNQTNITTKYMYHSMLFLVCKLYFILLSFLFNQTNITTEYMCHFMLFLGCSYIAGFMSKKTAIEKLGESEDGTCLLRFSESEVEDSQSANFQGGLSILLVIINKGRSI